MMRTFSAVLLALCLQSIAVTGRAAPAPDGCDELNALSGIACQLARELAGGARTALIVANDVRADRAIEDASALSRRLATVVAGRIGGDARAAATTATLATARGMARKRGTLLYLDPVIRDGALRVTADLFQVRLGFWDRIRMRPPGPVAHAYAERPLDPEIVSFLTIPDLVVTTRVRGRFSGGRALALACGRNPVSRALELVVGTRQRVYVGNIDQDAFVPREQIRWSDLASVAPVPLREPIGAASFRRGKVTVGISDRQSAMSLTPDLALGASLHGQVPWSTNTCLSVEGVALGAPVPCRPRRADAPWPLDGPVDAVAAFDLVDARGVRNTIRAARDLETATVVVRASSSGDEIRIPEGGAQLALGDLDLDGRVELLVSKDTLERKEDSVTIYTWDLTKGLEQKAEIPVPSGIDALAVCPHGRYPIAPTVVATRDQLWVLG